MAGDAFRTTVGVIALAIIGAGALHIARAAEWAEPTGIPPTANPPGFVWTRSPSDAPQAGGQFNVSGAGKIGGALEVIGKITAGELCFGQECKKAWAEVVPASVFLQAASPGTNQLGHLNISGEARVGALWAHPSPGSASYARLWNDGTKVILNDSEVSGEKGVQLKGSDLTVTGSVTARGCFGPVLRGRTNFTYQGNFGGYVQANAKCVVQFGSGAHVCATAEVLHSINCGAFASAGVASDTDMWIANLAPSLPTPTNDCIGWTTASGDWRGIKWRLNTTTGGGAYAESCGTSLPLACCR